MATTDMELDEPVDPSAIGAADAGSSRQS
jgi:hypothetical protein